MLAAGSKVGYKAFTLIQNDSLIDEGWVKPKLPRRENAFTPHASWRGEKAFRKRRETFA
jgi:hypothetical protein